MPFSGPDGNWTVKCTCCRMFFATAKEMKIHRYEKHVDELTCDFCEKIYTLPSEKKKHMEAKHNIIQRRKRHYFKCPKCGNASEALLPTETLTHDRFILLISLCLVSAFI